MAVKPVEYNHQSSSADLQPATQGASKSNLKDVTLTASNANEVKKDEDQGFTETLDKAQEAFLDGNVDTDTITYTEDEKKNVGKKAVDTKNSEKKTSAANVAATSQGATATAVASVFASLKASSLLSGIPFGCVIGGGIALAASIASLLCVKAFDDQYENRMSENSKASDTNKIIQQYNDTLNSNVEAMGKEASKYTELSGKTQDTNLNNVQELAALQIQYNDLMAQGNVKGAAEIKAQMDALKEGAATDPNADAMKECKDNIANYQQNSAEASGVAQSGSTVAGFLQNGKAVGIVGYVNAVILAACAIVSGLSAAKAATSAAKAGLAAILAAPAAAIAAALFLAAAATLSTASLKMSNKAKEENKCADSGDDMQSKVDDLSSQITTQSGETDTVSAGYTTEDTTVAEVTQKAQEAANKGVATSKTTTEENNKPKKPEEGVETGTGAGVAA